MLWYQLSRPFAFSQIKSRDLTVIRTLIPLIVTFVLALIYLVLPVKPSISGDKKYLDYILQVVGILPGFYIAALAAAATFSNDALDEAMPGRDAPELDIRRGGENFSVKMTMRVFLCHLFSYLSAISFVAALLSMLMIVLAPSYRYFVTSFADSTVVLAGLAFIKYAGVALVTFLMARIVIVTLHGLYFLVERMHQGNR